VTRFPVGFRLVAPLPPRRRRVSTRRGAGLGVAALLTLCLLGQGARADEEWVDEEPRWIPSLRFGFDTFEYDTQATVQNNLNPPRNAGTQNTTNRLFQFQLGGELMGPMFDAPGHPRLFVQAGAQFYPFSSDSVFDVGTGGDVNSDISGFQQNLAQQKARNCVALDTCPLIPDSFDGEGSEIDSQFQNLSWNAALGVAFSIPLADALLLELRPSIAYNIDRIEMSGSITTVFDTGLTTLIPATVGGVTTLQEVPDLMAVFGQASDKVTQHSLGPGLELGLVLFRSTRPVRASLYADVRFLWLLGDRTTTFSDSVATYEVRRDPFAIRGGAGLRFSWVGFEGD
jgi:hypothetical protein